MVTRTMIASMVVVLSNNLETTTISRKYSVASSENNELSGLKDNVAFIINAREQDFLSDDNKKDRVPGRARKKEISLAAADSAMEDQEETYTDFGNQSSSRYKTGNKTVPDNRVRSGMSKHHMIVIHSANARIIETNAASDRFQNRLR